MRAIHSADPVQDGQSEESGERTESCPVRWVSLPKMSSALTDKNLRRLPLRRGGRLRCPISWHRRRGHGDHRPAPGHETELCRTPDSGRLPRGEFCHFSRHGRTHWGQVPGIFGDKLADRFWPYLPNPETGDQPGGDFGTFFDILTGAIGGALTDTFDDVVDPKVNLNPGGIGDWITTGAFGGLAGGLFWLLDNYTPIGGFDFELPVKNGRWGSSRVVPGWSEARIHIGDLPGPAVTRRQDGTQVFGKVDGKREESQVERTGLGYAGHLSGRAWPNGDGC